MSAGLKFRQALQDECPLQVVGVINAFIALMAQRAKFRALYLSGAGVANMAYGLPDLGMTTLDNVVEEIRRITSVTDLPLLVDADTGWGDELMIGRVVKEIERAGAAGMHLEDQVFPKRCGHRPGKRLVDTQEMVSRIQAAVEAKQDPHFIMMARTDAIANEGLDGALARLQSYKAAGADMLFVEAACSLEDYRAVHEQVGLPVLANITEFGKTPLYTIEELAGAGVDLALYPLSAARAMNEAAHQVLKTIRSEGGQKSVVDQMQTREELYSILNYLSYEERIDQGAHQS